jgi:hypothetical protein
MSTTPEAYRSISKDWVACAGVDCFATSPFEPNDRLQIAPGIFGPNVEGERVPNPENLGGYLTSARRRDQEFMDIQRTLARWEWPKKTQEQFSRRISDISGRVGPLNAKLADFLAQYSTEEMLAITLGVAPVD